MEKAVTLQWGKERLEVQIGKVEDLDVFRAKVYSLTNVLPDKQKLFFKGKLIKEGTLESNGISSSSQLMLMGKAEGTGISLAQRMASAKVVFAEDLSVQQRAIHYAAVKGEDLPVGLHNLGNTCYVNSVAQLLHSVPELAETLNAQQPRPAERAGKICSALKALFAKMGSAGESFRPAEFLQAFFDNYPQFAEREADSPAFKQQDAEEALSLVLSDLASGSDSLQSVVEKLFGFSTTTFSESTEGETSIQNGHDRKLSCIIDNEMNPISQLGDGLRIGLQATVNKTSSVLGREGLFTQTTRLEALPSYLLIQQIRFVWREKDRGSNVEARKVKILRSVAFPPTLDVFELCSEQLKAQLNSTREAELERQRRQKETFEGEFEEFKKQKTGEEDNIKLFRDFKERQSQQENLRQSQRIWRVHGDQGNTGQYALIGVVTHQGRSADQGHYIAWVRGKGSFWHKYDDEEVTEVTLEEILNLKGGGDWHTAYLLLYRKLQFLPEDA